jgi:hypothetical protein
MDAIGTEQGVVAASLQERIDQGRMLCSEVLGDFEPTERECLMARTMYWVAYRAGVESTVGIDFSVREKTIIAAVHQELEQRQISMETR